MHCIHCNRPMKEPAVTIKSRAGPIYWGPKCARMAGLLTPRRPERKARQSRATRHTDQLDWINDTETT